MKILKNSTYEYINKRLFRLDRMEDFASQLYWLSEFPFFEILRRELFETMKGTAFRQVQNYREEIRKSVDDYFQNKMSKLEKDNELLTQENKTLKNAIGILEKVEE